MKNKSIKRHFESLESRDMLTIPYVSGFYSSKSAIAKDEQLLLSTHVWDSDANVQSVQFYVDDGDGSFDKSVDKLIGNDDDGADGWRTSVQTDGPYKIMALGDSITSARAPRNSYRYPLWQKLRDANYDFDFIGTQNDPDTALFDDDHEGHWGWRADQVAEKLPNWLNENVPDIVLLHIGTNDFTLGASVDSTILELDTIVSHLRAANPSVVILAAQLLPTRFASNALIDEFNARLPEAVERWNTTQSPVVVVDLNSPIDMRTDLLDGVHPSESGESIIANQFFEQIKRLRPLANPSTSFEVGEYMLFAVSTDAARNESLPATTSLRVEDPQKVPAILGISESEAIWVSRVTGESTKEGHFRKSDYTHFATGDVSGDGIDDIVGRRPSGRLVVGVAQSTGGFQFSDWGEWTNDVEWTDFQLADFNGDGFDDLVARSERDGAWWIGRSTGSQFENKFWSQYSPRIDWTFVHGDFNGDGRSDIAGRAASNGTWWVATSYGYRSDNSRWGRWSPHVEWHDVVVGDFNGDGRDDIAGRANNSSWYVLQSNGFAFTKSYWGSWTPTVEWKDVTVGDFNDDGRDDIAGRGDGNWWIAVSQAEGRFRHQKWGYWTTNTTWHDVLVFDANDDGRDDIAGRAANGQWWIFHAQADDRFKGSMANRWAAGTSWQLVVDVNSVF